MTHEITPDRHYVAGESVTWEFTVEEGGSAKDISGASLEWYLLVDESDANDDAELDHSDSGVTASITDAANGRFDVVIDQDTTTSLGGEYWQRVIVDDAGSGKKKWGGPFPIDRI